MNDTSGDCGSENEDGNSAHCSVGIIGRVGEREYKYRNGESRRGDNEPAKQWALLRYWAMSSKRRDAWVHKGG